MNDHAPDRLTKWLVIAVIVLALSVAGINILSDDLLPHILRGFTP